MFYHSLQITDFSLKNTLICLNLQVIVGHSYKLPSSFRIPDATVTKAQTDNSN